MSWFTVLRLLLYRSVLELFSKSFKVFHCSVINVRRCYFQQLVYFIISSSRCQQLFYFSLLSFFRGNSDILSCLSLFVNNFLNLFIWFKAEKEGFEPSRRSTRPIPLAGAPLRPLEYFSRYFLYKITSLRDALFILLKTVLFVNLFFNFYYISDANFLIDVSYRLFPSWSITTMAGKFSTYNFRIASAPRSS